MDAQQPSPSSRDRLPLAMTPSQAIALGLVAASLGWAVWLLRDRPTSEEVELLAGTALPSSEMAIMEAAFDRAQLTDHRTDAGRVWVPRSRQSAYMRALVDAEALPREFGGSLRRALEKNSPWQSRAVHDELLRVATQEELSLVICSMPGIERAAVLYDTEAHHGLEGSGPAKTASVNVRTQADMELDPARVQAIRVLVGASIAGLAPERVAVTDLRSGRVYVGPLEPVEEREPAEIAAVDPALARKIAHEHHLATKVRQSLAFLKGVTVDVTVEFATAEMDAVPLPPGPESLQSPASPESPAFEAVQKSADVNAPAEVRPRSAIVVAMPSPPSPAPAPPRQPAGFGPAADSLEGVLVSIAVPDSYFQAACRAAEERAGEPALQPIAVETQEMERIRRHVLSLLPATRDPSRRRVVITGFPVAGGSSARRESAARSGAASRGPRASGGSAPPVQDAKPDMLDAAIVAVAAGRLGDVPRQVWLAGSSIGVGLVAGFLWWAGGRRRVSAGGLTARRGMTQPRIDWSEVGDRLPSEPASAADGPSHAGVDFGIGRAAAVIIGLCICATAAEAGPQPEAAAIAPMPEMILSETAPASAVVRGADANPIGGAVPHVLPALPLAPRRDVAAPAMSGGAVVGAANATRADWKLLAAIVAAFAVVAAATALNRRRTAILPPDVFEVLGEGSLGGPHAVRIVRFGPKTLLIGVSAAGCQTLAELTDPQATACIAAACRGIHPPIRAAASPRGVGTHGLSSTPTPVRAGGGAA